jgi:septum formation protein
MKINQSFILASASPRRKLLLEKAGCKFKVIPSTIDESTFPLENISSIEHTKLLALEKAKDVAQKHPDILVMGADTVVDFNGRIIGKPKDAADAERITRLLFSAPHKVITAVALIRIKDDLEVIEAEVTTVYPKKLTENQVAEHIKNGDWRGKAGAYGIQEAGDEFVEKIEGSFSNVIGLPMELVQKLLTQYIGKF